MKLKDVIDILAFLIVLGPLAVIVICCGFMLFSELPLVGVGLTVWCAAWMWVYGVRDE